MGEEGRGAPAVNDIGGYSSNISLFGLSSGGLRDLQANLVSGNKRGLLALGSRQGTRILTTHAAVALLL